VSSAEFSETTGKIVLRFKYREFYGAVQVRPQIAAAGILFSPVTEHYLVLVTTCLLSAGSSELRNASIFWG
jgi:hypothetical protein